MLQSVKRSAHGKNSKCMILRSMFLQPGRIFKHWKPPLMQDSHHCAADLLRVNRINQGLWFGASQDNSLFANDMALDDPVAAAFIQIKLSLIDRWTGRTARVVAANISFGNIRTLQFRGPFQPTLPDLVMHGFEFSDRFV